MLSSRVILEDELLVGKADVGHFEDGPDGGSFRVGSQLDAWLGWGKG
jgi:hypothetical protein